MRWQGGPTAGSDTQDERKELPYAERWRESIGEAGAFLKRRGNPRGPRLEASSFLGARPNHPRSRTLVPSDALRACPRRHDLLEYVFDVQLFSERCEELEQAMRLACGRFRSRASGKAQENV